MHLSAAKLALPQQFRRETNSTFELVSDLQRLKRPVDDISFTANSHQRSRFVGIKFGNLTLHEVHADPAVTRSTIDPTPAFFLPFSTGATIIQNRRSICLPAASHVSLIAWNQRGELRTEQLHAIGIQPDYDKLVQLMHSMTGGTYWSYEAMVHAHGISYRGRVGTSDYIAQLLSLIGVVSGTGGDISLLNRIGISDVITNVLAELLFANVMGDPDIVKPAKLTRSNSAVDIICSHIESNIGTPLTVPMMETLTGMTGRSLAYAFQERFNCSPQQWQRNHLLNLAREELTSTAPHRSIKIIAYELGFSSCSSFSAHYRRKFGELPSQTVKPKASATHLRLAVKNS